MMDDTDAQRGGDGINGNVIMRRADAAGGEEIIIPGAQYIHRLDDRILIIGDDPHFGEANALHIEPCRNLRDILVLRSA
jgi:hypothetical protein